MTYIGNNIRKDMNNMSFVSMHNLKEGLIAIADSKSTIVYKSGEMIEDKKRGRIPKIFSNDNFIFTYYGNNELFASDKKMTMEQYVHINLEKDTSYKSFFYNMYMELCDSTPEYNDGKYHFIIGSKDSNNKYYILRLEIDITNRIFLFGEKDYGFNYYCGGDDRILNIYNQYPFYHDIGIKEYAKDLQWLLTQIVESVDTMSKAYNPVGLPINIEIFQ